MTDPYSISNFLLRVVILLFTCLALGACLSRARVHLAWLIPSAIGWGLLLGGTLLTGVFLSSVSISGHSSSPMEMEFAPTPVLSALGTLCLVWAAVATFLTMRGLAANTRPNPAVTETPGQWPPSPTPPVG